MSCDETDHDSSMKACRHVERIPFHARFPIRGNLGRLHFTQLEWKTLTDTSRCIPSGLMTPPQPRGVIFHNQVTEFLEITCTTSSAAGHNRNCSEAGKFSFKSFGGSLMGRLTVMEAIRSVCCVNASHITAHMSSQCVAVNLTHTHSRPILSLWKVFQCFCPCRTKGRAAKILT